MSVLGCASIMMCRYQLFKFQRQCVNPRYYRNKYHLSVLKTLSIKASGRYLNMAASSRDNALSNYFRFVSFNINSDRRLEWKEDPRFKYTALAFSDLSIKNRFSVIKAFILELINKKGISCLALQEIDDEALKLLQELFAELRFVTYTAKYCLHKDAYNYLLAVDERMVKVKETSQIYFTQSGLPTSNEERDRLSKEEKLQLQLDQEFEKSAQLAILTISMNEKTETVALVNIQAGTSNKHRLLAMQKLTDALKDCHWPVILAGDFNQFDASQRQSAIYNDQVQVLQKNGFQWVTEDLQRRGLQTTFFAFPHDVDRFLTTDEMKELAALKTHENYKGIRDFYLRVIEARDIELNSVCLDAVYAKNHGNIKLQTKPYTWLNGKVMNTAKQEMKEFRRSFLTFFKDKNAHPLSMPASDHFALATKIEFSSNNTAGLGSGI